MLPELELRLSVRAFFRIMRGDGSILASGYGDGVKIVYEIRIVTGVGSTSYIYPA